MRLRLRLYIITQYIKCKLGFHVTRSVEYVGYDKDKGIFHVRCIYCKTPLESKKEGTESEGDEEE